MSKITLFWFRRDLRLQDNAGLYHALKSPHPVLPLFIFDKNILDDLEDKTDARVNFIHDCLQQLNRELAEIGSGLLVKFGRPLEIWPTLLKEYNVASVFTNRDYEPYAIKRDAAVERYLEKNGVKFFDYKDQVIFEKQEVLKSDGTPYTVFTPYSRQWLKKLDSSDYFLKSYPNEKYYSNFWQGPALDLPTLEDLGFAPSPIAIPPHSVKQGVIRNYDRTRNFPAIQGTSRLGIHYRFGTISIREKTRKAVALNATYLNELIWRDFYAMILAHFPKVVKEPFREKYAMIQWRNNPEEFRLWCEGKTGYPMVDAGMRELNQSGYMHNRVRMITASFLTKHLLIDWRWGEAYFAAKLLDYELASNNGGWQWAAGTGTDAAPYFRIFNPESQQKKFDRDFEYIKRWVPEFGTAEYPAPIVEHKMARERCLRVYKEALAMSNEP